jgi:vitamin B12 transporter
MKLFQLFVTRRSSRFALAIGLSVGCHSSGWAQTSVTNLDPYITTATRTPVRAAQLGTTVDVISVADIDRRQISSLAGALGTIAGAPNFASGAMGAASSLFLRGANSNQTLFLVDGVRLNDPNTEYQVYLGGACLASCDSLEVSHGPQSTLYGGEAMGGVIALSAQPGSGAHSTRVTFEAGSFGTVQGGLHLQGERDATAYAFSLNGGHTDNDRVHNEFDSANLVGRVDQRISERLTVGVTLRGFEGRYDSPRDRFTNDPDNLEDESNWLATAFADFGWSETIEGRVTVGGQLREFVSTNPGDFGTQITTVENRRTVLDSQVSYTGVARHRVTVGLTAEANHTQNDGFGDIDEKQSLLAFFAQDEITLTDNAWMTIGFRSDDHDTFGRANTGRATLAWQVVPEQVKLRTSYGTAFRSPSFLDLYGQISFYAGNPNLRPEKAQGWDVGADVYFVDQKGSASVTYFDSDYENLIIFNFGVFPGTTANVDSARMRGVESTVKWSINPMTEIRVNYTYLEADNVSNDSRLLRRPRHSGGVDLWHDFGSGFDLGGGFGFVTDRKDVHAGNFSTIDGENYVVARVYAAWKINPQWKVRARVENALDETYEQVHGFPQPGIGGYVGFEWQY